MALSNSVLRRYTPPTCTLEIVAKSSPLSRWVGQSVIKDLRFELRFDDPRRPEDQRVTIRGDRTDLEVLCDAVNSYVQDFLDPYSTQLPLALQTPNSDSRPDDNRIRDSRSLPTSDLTRSHSVAAQASEQGLDDGSLAADRELNPKVRSLKPRTLPTDIYLQPKGLLNHNLFLGELATEESGRVVDLSVLQLFDLATALDEYAADVVALPNLNRAGWKATPLWTRAAAAVVVAVGVTTAAVKFLDQPYSQQEASAPTAGSQPSPAGTPLASIPTAPPTLVSPSPIPTPAVPPSLAASPTLLPPTPVAIPTAPVQNLPPGIQPPQQRPAFSINPPPQNTAIASKRAAPDPAQVALVPAPSAPRARPTPSPSGNTQAQKTTPRTPATPFPLPSLPSLTPSPSTADSSNAEQRVAPGNTQSAATQEAVSQADSARTDNAAGSRLSDTIPQVAEVRNYLQERWQPPSGLTQTLEYTLWLNRDGSILRIEPRGQAAGEYIDRTGIPRPGESFVSPVAEDREPKIRVVLTPDRKVQTFLE